MRESSILDNNNTGKNSYFPIIVGLLISLVGNFLFYLYISLNPNNFDYYLRITFVQISNWIIVIILVTIVLFWEKNSLSSLGLIKIKVKDLKWIFIVLILGLILFFISEYLINSINLSSQSNETVALLNIPISIKILMVFTAGITEEIIFRGYLIERINILSSSIIFSSLFSLIAFTVFHIPFWGIIGALQVGIWAIPITFYYVHSRNLTVCIIVHILYDAQILVPYFLN